MFQRWEITPRRGGEFVFEFFPVDRGSAAAGASGIAGLQHEVWDDPVEDDAVVVAAPDESLEVGAGFGGV
ncbi:hypothetical protein BELL_0833g00030 [Botrytis elliptica]|uniref:Uncharacterized protein n=1 Tax=Botrytis elliptica TaxID=278938 RepID=A0A4Z1J429_9HELO|nr:hypothetical protein BELL_0833g00030 [Botrytis elliptica]